MIGRTQGGRAAGQLKWASTAPPIMAADGYFTAVGPGGHSGGERKENTHRKNKRVTERDIRVNRLARATGKRMRPNVSSSYRYACTRSGMDLQIGVVQLRIVHDVTNSCTVRAFRI